jgi:hypothetical protein
MNVKAFESTKFGHSINRNSNYSDCGGEITIDGDTDNESVQILAMTLFYTEAQKLPEAIREVPDLVIEYIRKKIY